MNWKFWKKDELGLPELGGSSFSKGDAGFGSTTGLDLSDHFSPSGAQPGAMSNPAYSSPSFGQNVFTPAPAMIPPPTQMHEAERDTGVAKELEVIGAKLDTIRAQLEMLNTRVGNLERVQTQNQQQYPKRPWY